MASRFVASIIDIDSVDAFRPCQADQKHGKAWGRVVFGPGDVRLLCWNCANPKTVAVLRCSDCSRAPMGSEQAISLGSACGYGACPGHFVEVQIARR